MNAPPVSRPASGRRPSLTRQLLLWSLGALAIVWGSFVFIGYQTGVHEADPDTFRNQIRQDFFQIHISDFFDRFREFGFLYAVRNDEFFGLLCCDEKKSHERIKFDRLSCKFNQKNRK